MFGVTGTGLAFIRQYQNDGKNPRYSVDTWDKVSAAGTLGIDRHATLLTLHAAKYGSSSGSLGIHIYEKLTVDRSDGARPPIDRFVERTSSKRHSTSRVRVKQSVEGGFPLCLAYNIHRMLTVW